MNTRLESFDQLRARVLTLLVPDACHKLNNSIAVISGMAELTLHGSSETDASDSLNLVFDHARTVAKQISRLSGFSLSVALEIAVEDAGQAFDDAVGLLTPIFEVSGIPLHVDSSEQTHPVRIDKHRLIQVLVVLTCSPLISADPDDFAFGTKGKLESVKLSIATTDSGTAIEIGFPLNRAEESEATAELVQSTLAEFGASVTVDSRANETVFQISLSGLE